jgi:hypothetical protein
VPAAAVIPAPIAYTKIVAVKKLVVGRYPVIGSVSYLILISFYGFIDINFTSL